MGTCVLCVCECVVVGTWLDNDDASDKCLATRQHENTLDQALTNNV